MVDEFLKDGRWVDETKLLIKFLQVILKRRVEISLTLRDREALREEVFQSVIGPEHEIFQTGAQADLWC